jgi:ubiquitin-like modifier-activating enzyme 5
MDIKPNPGCPNPLCHQRQQEWAAGAAARDAAAAAAAAEHAVAEAAAGPVHESNEWHIEVVTDDGPDASGGAPAGGPGAGPAAGPAAAQQQQQQQQQLPEGLQFAMPAAGGVDASVLREEAVQATDVGVDDLMAQLEQLAAGK